MSLPTLYTTTEFAAAFSVSERYIRDKVRDGVLHPLRLSDARNAQMRFSEADVVVLVRAMQPPEPAPLVGRRRRRRRF